MDDLHEIIDRIKSIYIQSHPLDIDINFLQELDNIVKEYCVPEEC